MSTDSDFEQFWAAYPKRVGKIVAQKAYQKARKSCGATQDELLDGIAKYRRGKPEYADWAHPATWLNQGRWMDEYDEPKGTRSAPVYVADFANWCQHEPRCHSRTWHQVVIDRERGEVG